MEPLFTVGQFLDAKGRHVVTVDADSFLTDCARAMLDAGVGSVIVVDGRAVRGIVTWRDVLASLADVVEATGQGATTSIMTRSIYTATEDQALDEVEAMMVSHAIRHVPVVRHSHLVGLITRSDLIARKLSREVRVPRQVAGYLTAAARGRRVS